MGNWSLQQLLASLNDDIERRLENARECFGHPTTKGDASENVWLQLLQTYLPKRYSAEKAHVVDSNGVFSAQIDVVVFDRQYSPFIFNFEGQKIIPAESVYAVFEAKQDVDSDVVKYAQEKIASVRRLHRTSLPIPHAGGVYPPKSPIPILGGLLAFNSKWTPPLGTSLVEALGRCYSDCHLELGCIAAKGLFSFNQNTSTYEISTGGKPATAFLLELISRLQSKATVPMIDVQAYARWLSK